MVYTHYETAPFLNAQHHGLTVDLANELTKRSVGRYEFVVQPTPRKRIDFILSDPNWQGIVPWVTSVWFRDEAQTKYAWSASLFTDADLVLSHQPFTYVGPESLFGMRFGGVLGHRYAELEQWIAEGKIQRDDALSEIGNLKKLQAKRVDVVFISNSNWIAILAENPSLSKGIVVAKKPRNVFERKLLISPKNPQLTQYVQRTVESLRNDADWQKKVSPYHYALPK